MSTEPVAPKIPMVGESMGDLDGWEASEDPKQGRDPESIDDCDEEHADR